MVVTALNKHISFYLVFSRRKQRYWGMEKEKKRDIERKSKRDNRYFFMTNHSYVYRKRVRLGKLLLN